MWLRVLHGRRPFKLGYALLELIMALIVSISVLSILLGGYQARISRARIDKTVTELISLAQASIEYYRSRGYWPASPGVLNGSSMYSNLAVSPFGNDYRFNSLNRAVTVSTVVPSGFAQGYDKGGLLQVLPDGNGQDTVEITRLLSNAMLGRLEYESKYEYKQ